MADQYGRIAAPTPLMNWPTQFYDPGQYQRPAYKKEAFMRWRAGECDWKGNPT